MLRRFLAFWICAMIMFSPCCFSERERDHVAEDIEGYLGFAYGIRNRELYAFEYVEAFLTDRTQENLLKARAAVQAALWETKNAVIPESAVADDEIDRYSDADVSIEVIFGYYEAFEDLLKQSERTLENVMDFLLFNVYYLPAADNYAKRIVFQKRYTECLYLNALYTSEYLLLELQNAGIITGCPGELAAYLPKNASDPGLEKTDYIALLDENSSQIEACIRELDVLGGMDQYVVTLMEIYDGMEEYLEFSENATQILNRGAAFPLPVWLDAYKSEYLYLMTDDQGNPWRIRTDAGMDKAPDLLKVVREDVSVEQIAAYIETLTRTGYEPAYEYTNDGENSEIDIIAVSGESMLMIVWTPDKTVFYLTQPLADLAPVFCLK